MNVATLRGILDKSRDVAADLQFAVQQVNSKAVNQEYTNDELVDISYLLKEIEKQDEEMRLNCSAINRLLYKLIFMRAGRAFVEGEDMSGNIKGKLATATPDSKTTVNMPKPGTPEYLAVMKFLQVPQEIAESGIFKLSFSELSDKITQLVQAGHKVPPELGKTFDTYNVRFVARKR